VPEQEGGIRAYCACGTQVWHVQTQAQLPRYESSVICHACGRENGRRPPVAWLLKFYWARLKKRRRIYGLEGMWGATYPVSFWQFRQYPPGWREAKRQGQLPYQLDGLGPTRTTWREMEERLLLRNQNLA